MLFIFAQPFDKVAQLHGFSTDRSSYVQESSPGLHLVKPSLPTKGD